jgi:hypothetical protein
MYYGPVLLANMVDVTVRVHRNMAERSDDVQTQEEYHRQRSHLLHALVDALDIQVKNWDITDADIQHSHEWDNVIMAFGSAAAFTAAVTAFQVWLERRKVDNVEIIWEKGNKKKTLRVRGGTPQSIRSFSRQLNFK